MFPIGRDMTLGGAETIRNGLSDAKDLTRIAGGYEETGVATMRAGAPFATSTRMTR